jgi:hypothetical protein
MRQHRRELKRAAALAKADADQQEAAAGRAANSHSK